MPMIRDDWYRFGSLAELLRGYVEVGGEKYWERTGACRVWSCADSRSGDV